MSYDLYFWRETARRDCSDEEMLDLHSAEERIAGVADFPRDKVREAFRRSFPGIVDGDIQMEWEGDGSYFQVEFTHSDEKTVHVITVTCGYELLKAPSTMNRILDACATLGCAAYDPQSRERYEQPK